MDSIQTYPSAKQWAGALGLMFMTRTDTDPLRIFVDVRPLTRGVASVVVLADTFTWHCCVFAAAGFLRFALFIWSEADEAQVHVCDEEGAESSSVLSRPPR